MAKVNLISGSQTLFIHLIYFVIFTLFIWIIKKQAPTSELPKTPGKAEAYKQRHKKNAKKSRLDCVAFLHHTAHQISSS